MRLYAKLKLSNGLNALKMAVHQWRVIPAWEGHPPAETRKLMDQVRKKVLEYRRLTVQEIVAEVGISTGSVHSILTEDLTCEECRLNLYPSC